VRKAAVNPRAEARDGITRREAPAIRLALKVLLLALVCEVSEIRTSPGGGTEVSAVFPVEAG
jgi:hypothetical protein